MLVPVVCAAALLLMLMVTSPIVMAVGVAVVIRPRRGTAEGGSTTVPPRGLQGAGRLRKVVEIRAR